MAAIGAALPSSSVLCGNLRKQRRFQLLLAADRGPPSRHWLLRPPRITIGDAAALPLASISPASGGNLSVLIPISIVLLVFYWVANFVVPDMVARDLQQQDELSRDQVPEETNDEADEKLSVTTPNFPARSTLPRVIKRSRR
ncbi:unnamed protein product [Spirodela intermedia]|uniref:Uncharacterized protein n=1 Tax=Spirodela intermedia TaxID=51605 RepID=A0A7I8KXW3_SPIIN|nr:unnamed protein product [Spirodela intermedia]